VFLQMFDRLLGNEGGYVNNPADPGGETNWGISKRQYPSVDIKNLTKEEAEDIYYRDFWQPLNLDTVHAWNAFNIFDAAVNHGIPNAVRILQEALGIAPDGHFGPISQDALANHDDAQLAMRFIAARIEFWTKLSTWGTFGRGWANRAAADLKYAALDLDRSVQNGT